MGKRDQLLAFFLPENFLVATPMRLTWKVFNGGTEKGPIMKFASISFLMRRLTVSGSARADWR